MSESPRKRGRPPGSKSKLGAADLAQKPRTSDEFHISTTQETNALLFAASDGHTGRHWMSDTQACRRSHTVQGASHYVLLELTDDERAAGHGLEKLEALTIEQDSNFVFAMLYISRLLCPPHALPSYVAARAMIDLDDVVRKIGLDPRTPGQREQARMRVWNYIRFGTSAHIVGRRTGKYRDKETDEEIDTVINVPAWNVGLVEGAPQNTLFPEMAAPRIVELTATETWTRLTTSPETAQFLPMGEVLGAIPAGRQSGAWARVIGLALANFWRRKPREALDGSIKPTRFELLDKYPPATGPVEEILKGTNPRHAVEYWHAALRLLCDCGFLERSGEAARTLQDVNKELPRQNWQETWLNGTVFLRPGQLMEENIMRCAKALPVPTSTNLQKRKRGRPRKNPN